MAYGPGAIQWGQGVAQAAAFVTTRDPVGAAFAREACRSNALAERGLSLSSDYVAEGAYTFESGAACAELLLSRTPRPTAIFAGNDETAAGVYRTAYLRGLKIPDDLTVIGFDDSPLASRLCPSLTTMRQPIRDMGRVAAEKVIAKIAKTDGPSIAASTVFPHLVVRESSGRPRS